MKRGRLLIISLILVVFLISSVSALNACCEKSEEDWCVYTDENSCDESYLASYTTCEQTSFCQTGTCYSSDTGSCYGNTPKSTCSSEEGMTWTSNDLDDVEQCQRGCCTIGDQAFYVSEVKCKSVGSQYEEATVNFDASIYTEALCLDSVKNDDWGCCVADDEAEFTIRSECSTADNEVETNLTVVGFHEGMLCSNDLLSTDCAKQHHTDCYDGQVYWYDSCGNKENIYSSDERTSYNSGYVLEESESCTIDGAYDESCGNCEYADGTICGYDNDEVMPIGEYTCVDLNCDSTFEHDVSPLSGGEKLNGESWCVYDSVPGEGGDAVGSRHYRHLCINGEEVVESCADYREELCINGLLDADVFENLPSLHLSEDNSYVEAACRDNRFEECSSCNSDDLSLSQQYSCCTNEDIVDCYWLSNESSRNYGYGEDDDNDVPGGMCVPQVPPGLQFWSEDGTMTSDDTAAAVCQEASTECVATYRLGGWSRVLQQKTDRDKWDLVSSTPDGCINDDGEMNRDWLINQNTICRSLGDCGAYYNYEGDFSDDGFFSNAFDEEFFFEMDPLDSSDVASADDLFNVDGLEEGKWLDWKSENWYQNPATYIGLGTFLIGGVAGATSCSAQDAAKATATQAGAEMAENAALAKAAEAAEAAEAAKAAAEAATPAVVPVTPATPAVVEPVLVAPEVPYYVGGSPGELLGQGSAVLSGVDKVRSTLGSFFTDGGATCFIGSGLPLIGLFMNSNKKMDKNLAGAAGVYSKVKQAKDLTGKAKYLTDMTKSVGKAKTSGTIARWANAATIATAVYMAVEYGLDNETTIVYNVDCGLWQAPKGGDNCEECNNAETPCSEYKCRSLGASCDLVNEGSSNETCVSLNVNDVNSPQIEALEELISDDYTISPTVEESNKGFVINEKIPAFTSIQLGLNTDEPAQCKYSSEPSKEFDDMNNYFGSEVYLYNHSIVFTLGSEFTDSEIMALTEGEYTIYVRCSDAMGNANERDYFIRFSVDDTPDLTPPEVVFTSIDSGSYIMYGVDELALSVYTNELASCSWSVNDEDYTFMTNIMSCPNTGFEQSSAYFGTYECSTTLEGVSADELNYFYFRCIDEQGNVNEESYQYITKQTENDLEIISVSPEGDVSGTNVSLEIETTGGVENGEAVCSYYVEDVSFESMIEMAETNGSVHSQDLDLSEGDYTFYVGCQDTAGNQDYNYTEISLEFDYYGPSIESIYVDLAYSVLFIEVDEESNCEYASESFTYGEGTSMTGVDSTEHEASLESLYYYVICEDLANNQASYEVDISAWT